MDKDRLKEIERILRVCPEFQVYEGNDWRFLEVSPVFKQDLGRERMKALQDTLSDLRSIAVELLDEVKLTSAR